MNFSIDQQLKLDIPSASGLARHGDFYYVLGDDSPFLFKLNSDFQLVEKIPLFGDEQRQKIPKPEKADFEALEMISGKELLGFGSGSRSPQRDKIIKIKIGEKASIKEHSLTKFYSFLKNLEIMQGSELNIEAAAFHKNLLFLFNRRKNVIFSFSFSEFILAIEKGTVFPAISAFEYQLPKIDGIEAGFSGATTTASGNLVVTCSVEDTDNAYDDGEVLGSFVGISSGVKNGIFDSLSWTRINSETPLKVESVVVSREISKNLMELVLVTDSDGADSILLKGRLTL